MLWAPKGGTMRGGFIASTANKYLAHLAHLFRTPPWHTCFELHMLVLVRTVARWLPVAAFIQAADESARADLLVLSTRDRMQHKLTQHNNPTNNQPHSKRKGVNKTRPADQWS